MFNEVFSEDFRDKLGIKFNSTLEINLNNNNMLHTKTVTYTCPFLNYICLSI